MLHLTTLLLSLVAASRIFSSSDEQKVVDQLGYLPTNYLSVAAWTANDLPLVLQTHPLQGGSPRRQARSPDEKTPFPTLYWLAHDEISTAVSNLERQGHAKEMDAFIRASTRQTDALRACHYAYANERWSLLSFAEQVATTPSVRNILRDSGIAGSNLAQQQPDDNRPLLPYVKCLHAHYAHYRAQQQQGENVLLNPVGALVHELLAAEYPALIL